MELYQIRQFSRIDGVNRNPAITEHLGVPRWDNNLGYFEFIQLSTNTKVDEGLVKKGDDSVAGNYIWKLDANKNPDWRLEQYLVSVEKDAGSDSALFTLNDGSILTLPLGALAWSDGTIPEVPVTSVFGRTGDVVATTGDYHASQVTCAFNKCEDTLDDILEGVFSYHFTAQYKDFIEILIANHIDDIVDIGSGRIITDYERSLLHNITENDAEFIRDTVADFIQDGTGIYWDHNDPADTLTPTVHLNDFDTDDLEEGTINLYYTDARARAAISLTVNNEGLSTLTYDNTTGVFTFSPVTAAQVRSLFSATYPLAYDPTCGVFTWEGGDCCTDCDSGGSGGTSTISQPLHGFSVLQAVRLDIASGLWVLAQADTDTHSGTMGIVIEIIDVNNFKIQSSGIITLNPNPFVDGMWYFLSPTVAGEIIEEPSYDIGNVREFIGSGRSEGLWVELDLGDVIDSIDLGDLPTGTVTSITAGNGMNFSTITVSGDVTMGTPSTITSLTVDALTATSHTHALDTTGVTAATYIYPTITVDDKGRITSAVNGTPPVLVLNSDNSVTGDGSIGDPFQLVNDEPSPTINKYYGTDATGVLGYHALTSGGTVTSITAGAGMNFTTITGVGNVAMGTPSTLSVSTVNNATGTTHTHALDITGLYWDVNVNSGTPLSVYNADEVNFVEGLNVTIVRTGSDIEISANEAALPSGGTEGQIITINSADDVVWQDACEVLAGCSETILDIIQETTGNVSIQMSRADCEDSVSLAASNFVTSTLNLTTIRIDSVPSVGTLTYNAISVIAGQEIPVTLGSFSAELLYTTDSGTGSAYNDLFTFSSLYSSNTSYSSTFNVNVSVDACVTESVCFGYLYNWYAVDDSRKLTSSVDWVMPTEADALSLQAYLGGLAVAGGKMKETGLVRWTVNNDATNSTGFSGIGSGLRRGNDGVFISFGGTWAARLSVLSKSINLDGNDADFRIGTGGGDEDTAGRSIRLVKDATGLADGVTTTYVGNDGKTYNAIVIDELYWTTENLEETEYRNGDAIPNVIDNTTWSNLTTGALCLYDNDANNACKLPLPTALADINYGYLYNWWAVDDARSIASTGWHVASTTEWTTLTDYLGGESVAGGELKETGDTYWYSNVGATNNSSFNSRGAGVREIDGLFQSIKVTNRFWTSTLFFGTLSRYRTIFAGNTTVQSVGSVEQLLGLSVRLIKDSTTLLDGEVGIYIGNDGKIYRTICIGTQEWLADNLAETKYANGDWITGYDGGVYTPISDAAWIALTTEAMCVYNNDESNK